MSSYKPAMKPLPITRCMHITCKGLEVFGDDYRTPDDEVYRSSSFHCRQTQRCMGPDGGLVMLSACAEGRKCYEPL